MANPAIKTRFIILSAQRSGSTALTGALNSHPDVYCHGHPFFQSDKFISALRPDARAAMDYTQRASDPVAFAYNVLDYTTGPVVIGFKIWPHKEEDSGPLEALNALSADATIKKIILRRENDLACHSSEVLVNLKRQQPSLFDGHGPRPQARFNKMGFMKFYERRKGWFDHYDDVVGSDALRVPYVGLLDETIAQISDFLELPSFGFKEVTSKRNTNDILNRYRPEDQDKVRRTLDEIGHPEWVTEE